MATIADTACTPELIASLREAGMSGVRINSAHAAPEAIKRMTEIIRGVDPGIAILMDTKGAEIRTTATAGDAVLALGEGDTPTIIEHAERLTDRATIAITATGICDRAPKGTQILLDDGEVELEVTGRDGNALLTRVTKAGRLGARKTVCFRGVEAPEAMPALTERDRRAIEAGIEAGIDIIAHSFVRSAADVEAVRALTAGSEIELYAKIECLPALDNFDGILGAADGLLCARGDLGAEAGIERVPSIQMRIASGCRATGKPMMVATQMMQSMMQNPSPTRAEANDIAMATIQGARWMLLCGETATGPYPRECVEWMKRIADATVDYMNSHH